MTQGSYSLMIKIFTGKNEIAKKCYRVYLGGLYGESLKPAVKRNFSAKKDFLLVGLHRII